MSLFKKATKLLGKVAGKVAPLAKLIPGKGTLIAAGLGAISQATSRGSAALTQGATMSMLPALPAAGGRAVAMLPRVIPGAGKIISGGKRILSSRAVKAIGTAATGVAVVDAVGNIVGTRRKSRRMNPMNWRALNRALKRVEKAKKAAKRINAVSIRKEKC